MPSADNFHSKNIFITIYFKKYTQIKLIFFFNLSAWYGVLFVHKGYYKNGVFKFKLEIPSEYPFL
jgi:ubiquitin-protein ligase